MARVVTLLTDFGTSDPYVAAMKGVILRTCPDAQIVDVSHDVGAHDVFEAAFVLAQAAPWFPPGTLHVVVVDPGVGTDRAILAARFDGQRFLFPDNGVITFVAQAMSLEAIAVVAGEGRLLPENISTTFHGRDIFAPIAGHLLRGLPIGRLGPQPKTHKLFDVPQPREDEQAILGQVIFVDGFGNLVSNIDERLVRTRWPSGGVLDVVCAARRPVELRESYGTAPTGEPLALFNSMQLLELAVNRGRACDFFGAGVGAEIRITRRP